MAKECPLCGRAYEDDCRFCDECGEELKDAGGGGGQVEKIEKTEKVLIKQVPVMAGGGASTEEMTRLVGAIEKLVEKIGSGGGGGGGGGGLDPSKPIAFYHVKDPALEKKKHHGVKGVALPSLRDTENLPDEIKGMVGKKSDKIDKSKINETYPLIPRHPKHPKEVKAWAWIKYDPKGQDLVYNVIEPPLTPNETDAIEKIKARLEERLDMDFGVLSKAKAHLRYLTAQIDKLLEYFDIKLSKQQMDKIKYYIFRDFVGMGKIEPLVRDPNIEDISCDGIGIPIYIFHRNSIYGEMRSNIAFKTKEEMDNFVMKMAQKTGKTISVAEPLLDGTLPDGSRLQATYGSDIARKGSNFTIRKFTDEPLTPIHLLQYGTINHEALAYLWIVVEAGSSVLVAGPTATGKTTMLGSIALFIKPEQKIVSIEDTAELRLPHPNWLPQVARSDMGKKGHGTVDMADLLKAALRQRPDYILVGEVRGEEAAIMFQGMATGHAAMGTIHADDLQKIVDRLVTPPINLSPALIQHLDVIIFIVRTRMAGKFVRRVSEIVEVEDVDVESKRAEPRIVFEWDPTSDELEPNQSSRIIGEIARLRGIKGSSLQAEVIRRTNVLRWAEYKGVVNYKAVGQLIASYYQNPDEVLKHIRKDLEALKSAQY